jgi:hypothetical protein
MKTPLNIRVIPLKLVGGYSIQSPILNLRFMIIESCHQQKSGMELILHHRYSLRDQDHSITLIKGAGYIALVKNHQSERYFCRILSTLHVTTINGRLRGDSNAALHEIVYSPNN